MMHPNEDNPYLSPAETNTPQVAREVILRRVALAWQFPLIGVLLGVAGIAISALPIATSLSVLVLMMIMLCWIFGITMFAYGLIMARGYEGVWPHLLGGLTANMFLTGILCSGVAYLFLSVPSPVPAARPLPTVEAAAWADNE